MAEKADSNKQKLQKPAARQTADKEASGPEHRLQEAAAQIASALDAPDPEGQARRLADSRFPAVQRQALAEQISRQQGNRHLSAVLAQLAAVPAASTPSIQREALPDIVGQRVGTMVFEEESTEIEVESRAGETVPLVVETELVPEGQQPGQFVGYDRQIHAHSRAAAEPNICAVVLDNQGKYHALRTSQLGRTRDYNATLFSTAGGFRRVYFVNRPQRRPVLPHGRPVSWSERVRRALAWLTDLRHRELPDEFREDGCLHTPNHGGSAATLASFRVCLETEFSELLAIALDINPSLVNRVRGDDRGDPNALVNFNLDMTDSGLGGRGHLPHGRAEPVPAPSVTIGPPAFERESHLSVVATAIHESEHGRQALDATELLEEWRRRGGRRDFPDWLRQQLRRRRNPISQEQHDLALNLWRAGTRGGDPRGTTDRPHEVLAYLEDFIRTYPNRPLVRSGNRFTSLDSAGRFWTGTTSEHIRQRALQRMADFYPTLDQDHRDDLRDSARGRARRADPDKRPFYQALVARLFP